MITAPKLFFIAATAAGIGVLAACALYTASAHQTLAESRALLLENDQRIMRLDQEKRKLEKELQRVRGALEQTLLDGGGSPAQSKPEVDWLCDRVPCNPGEKLRKEGAKRYPSCPPGDPLCSPKPPVPNHVQ